MSYNVAKAMKISNTSFTQNPQLNTTTRTHPRTESSPLYIPIIHKMQIHIFVYHVILSFNNIFQPKFFQHNLVLQHNLLNAIINECVAARTLSFFHPHPHHKFLLVTPRNIRFANKKCISITNQEIKTDVCI
jgi:hypothetical protein